MKFKPLLMVLALGIGTALAGCSSSSANNTSDNKNKKLEVYTTIYPLQDFTEKIGGKYVEAKSILPTGVDAHSSQTQTHSFTQELDLKVLQIKHNPH
jgi:zinc transport system substrate-binding protein